MASIEKRYTKRGEQRWELRYRVRGREVSRTFKTRTDAINFRRGVEHDELQGIGYDPRAGKITLTEWWALWWPTTVKLRESSRARDESYWRGRIEPAFGTYQLADIDRAALGAWIVELTAEGLAPATVHKIVQILTKTLRAAVNDGRLARNPADRLDLPQLEDREMRFLTPHEVEALADAIDERYRALVVLGAYGGLRLGEMFALRAEHVDLLHGHLDVMETVATVRGRIVVNAPKTKAGKRRVPLPRIVVEALEEHIAAWPGELVFTAPEGGYVRSELWRRRFWHPAVERAGLAPLRPHDLRHTAVGMWIAAGASPNEIKSRAGHTSTVVVLDRYGHRLPGTAERVTDALDAMAKLARDGRGMQNVVPLHRDAR